MHTNADEIFRACGALGYDVERFFRLAPEEARHVYDEALCSFVPSERPRRWWEHFPAATSLQFVNGDGWLLLAELTPDPDERVWFIAEDHPWPEYSVWEGSVRDVQRIIGECFGFEYYLVQQQHRWLLCENHHDYLIAVGHEVEERLWMYSVRNGMRE